MFNATLAPIVRSERICSSAYYYGEDLAGNSPLIRLEPGEVIHSIEPDWDATRELRDLYEIKSRDTILVVHYTTRNLVRQAEEREAERIRKVGSFADIWPSV